MNDAVEMTTNQLQQNISIKLADDYLSTLLTGNIMKFPVDLTKYILTVYECCYCRGNVHIQYTQTLIINIQYTQTVIINIQYTQIVIINIQYTQIVIINIHYTQNSNNKYTVHAK